MKAQREISSFGLKMVAIITMFIDHITASGAFVVNAMHYTIGRGIGRIAFPLFCFLLVEGYTYSKNRMVYLAKLILFAFISEVPFDLLFRSAYFDHSYQNVFFTLAIGLATIMILGEIDHYALPKIGNLSSDFQKNAVNMVRFLEQFVVIVVMAGMAEFLKTDYSSNGILLIVMIFYFEKFYVMLTDSSHKYGEQKVKNMLAAFAVFLWFFFYDMKGGGINEAFGFPVILLIYYYNGKRGKYLLPSWFFYVFYPVHLGFVILLRNIYFGM